MAEISKFVPLLLKHEGGYTNNPNDKGNYNSLGQLVGTKYGVSAKAYETYFGKVPNETDMRTISPAQFETVARKYWDKWQADKIACQPIANFLVDFHYNSGTAGIKIPQKFMHLNPDGIVGPKTLQAINTSDPFLLFIGLKAARKEFIDSIIFHDPSQAIFKAGWYNRVDSFTFTT